MGLAAGEDAEFAELLLSLAQDAWRRDLNFVTVLPVMDDQATKSAAEETEVQPPPVAVGSLAQAYRPKLGWLDGQGDAGHGSDLGRAGGKTWKAHVVESLLHFGVTLLVSLPLPLGAPLLITATEGSKVARLALLLALGGMFVFITYRIFWVCSGLWSRKDAAFAFWLAASLVSVVGVLGPPRLRPLAPLGPRFCWSYVLTVLCCDRVRRPLWQRAVQVLGFLIAALPFYFAPWLMEWSAGEDMGRVSAAGRQMGVRTALAALLWTALGIFVQVSGALAWRWGCSPGRKTLKVFEFNVHMEVALTASGMQLFRGQAMLLYVLWALGVYGANALLLLAPWTRSAPDGRLGWLFRQVMVGSTPALRIVHLFVNLMAKAYGILVGLAFVLLCTLAQLVLHPGCQGHAPPGEPKLSLRAPTLEVGQLWLWCLCVLLCVAAMACTSLVAVRVLGQVAHDATSLRLAHAPGPGAAASAPVVAQMAKERPLGLLLGVAHVCTWGSRVEVRGIIAMQLLLMPVAWFGYVSFDSAWQEADSWFFCE